MQKTEPKLEASAPRWKSWDALLLLLALSLGLAIAWIDSRPHWNDDGITAGMLLLSASLLGLIGPRRPWLWALAVGLWVPLNLNVQKPSLGNILGGFVILAFPMAGAYMGMGVRRLMGRSFHPQT
jgi:hypothetical protein